MKHFARGAGIIALLFLVGGAGGAAGVIAYAAYAGPPVPISASVQVTCLSNGHLAIEAIPIPMAP